MVYVLEGEVEVTISGKPISLKQGEITIMPANQPHALAAKTKFKMLLNNDKILKLVCPKYPQNNSLQEFFL